MSLHGLCNTCWSHLVVGLRHWFMRPLDLWRGIWQCGCTHICACLPACALPQDDQIPIQVGLRQAQGQDKAPALHALLVVPEQYMAANDSGAVLPAVLAWKRLLVRRYV